MLGGNVEIRETPESCTKGNREHRLYALEYVSNESTKISIIPLACTACGTLFLHKVQAE